MTPNLQPMLDPYKHATLKRRAEELWRLYREALQELSDYEEATGSPAHF